MKLNAEQGVRLRESVGTNSLTLDNLIMMSNEGEREGNTSNAPDLYSRGPSQEARHDWTTGLAMPSRY